MAASESTIAQQRWMQWLFTLGCVSGCIAVAAGAAGAHALQTHFVDRGAEWWSLAVDYHAVHALAMLFSAWAVDRWPGSLGARAAGACFFIGILFFCGGLYLRALGSEFPLIHLVPVGGSIWLVGWLSLAVAPWR